MAIRLNKVIRDLNVGITTAVEFLRKKGFAFSSEEEKSPSTKITDEQYNMLVKEFSTDKHLKQESERFIQERHGQRKGSSYSDSYQERKSKPKAEEFKTVVPEEVKPKFKPVGKIDLNNLSTHKTAQQPQKEEKENVQKNVSKREESKISEELKTEIILPEAPKPAAQTDTIVEEKQAPVTTEDTKALQQPQGEKVKPESQTVPKPVTPATEQPVPKQPALQAVEQPAPKRTIPPTAQQQPKRTAPQAAKKTATAITATAASTETPAAAPEKHETEVFSLHKKEEFASKINIIGQIDLATLNQSTRPRKKSKAERRKEREEKEKLRQDQKKAMKEAIIKEIRRDDAKTEAKEKPKGTPGGATDKDSKKKRHRINKEKVDVTNAANFQNNNSGGSGKGKENKENKNTAGATDRSRNKGEGKPAATGGGRGKERGKKAPVVKHEPSEEDVAKQVKETLARLTAKGKSKASKYRKEKRGLVAGRMQEQESMEREGSRVLKLTEFVTANELANMMDISVTQVIATCMSVGIMVSINQRLDAETINLVAEEFGFKTEYVSAEVSQAIIEEEDAEEDLQPRAPIVTVMGHVDHGKTSLLDYIRKANVIAGEAGGITQHIGAYNVTLEDGRKITFLDTPGHEAFTAMRARGAKVTDVAIIIVAADDNVMPQTKEAINHAMAAGVPIVFAINKIDKPGANPDKIKEELSAMNFLIEEWGGKYQSQDISAKKGTGVKELMEKVLLEAEMLDLKANPDRKATGSIIESSLDKGRGYVATVLISNGTLHVGDIVLAGASYGKVKAMFNERNQRIKEAGPSEPVLILGLNGAPAAGDSFHVFDTEQEAREIAAKREQLQREQGLRTQKMLTLDEVGRRLALGDFHELNVIVKGDVDGSVEALSDSLIKLSTEQIQVNVIHKGVGQISESDVSLAAASNAIIIGFQVRPSNAAARQAESEGVDIRKYSVIYDAIEEVKAAMVGMLAPTMKEQITATLEVREVFNITKVGLVAGALVKTGKVKRSDKARLIREGIVIYTGHINALKRFKDDVKEVGVNFECGISLTNCNDIKIGDIIESYEEIEVKATL
ncbi:MAG: translation initiation factor IF-2 [Prevotellaceae bacterium]|jgi:translation initiation factor IF-2|nr:translation initiation factor IF-2 [Prevotellaceae bacterium]